MKTVILYAFVFIGIGTITLMLSGCNTMGGFGDDVQSLGRGISRADD